MSRLSRRNFLKTVAAAATVTIAGTKSTGKVLGANETIRIGVAGLNGRGGAHTGAYAGMKDVQITYLIDPDTRTYAKHLSRIKGSVPKTVQDVRKALEDKELDAISIATTNHWHALMTIWACQAGKDVYVEKPCSHNVHEGRIAVEAARKYGRMVQHGTQSRAGTAGSKIAALAQSGKLGKLLVSRGLCYKDRNNASGRVPSVKPVDSPTELDFNLWLGPAALRPYHENLVHYRWHWFWDFGNGDIGNQGVHQMDIARWAIPGATLPRSVMSVGGRFGSADQGETPDTQVTLMDFGTTQLIFEVRGLKTDGYYGEKVGNTFHFEAGTIAANKFYPKGSDKAEPIPAVEITEGKGRTGDNFGNFIGAIRSRKYTDLHADILEGHYSSALCHLANISYRLGEQVPFSSQSKAFGDNKDAYEALVRMQEHLSKDNGLKLEGGAYRLGKKLTIDPKTEKFVGDPKADELLTRNYRKPFVVPEKV